MTWNIFVAKHGSNWQVLGVNGQCVKTFYATPTQHKAAAIGKILAEVAKGELTVQGEDGKIITKNSYGNDPFPPRDKDGNK